MSYRCCVCSLFVFLINVVSVQSVHVVEAILGETVILPCTKQTNQTTQTVYWRYSDSTTVFDIISGEVKFDEQDPVYKGRVVCFPLEFAKGNFSIKLSNVKQFHEGIYTCNFPSTLTPQTIQLNIKESHPRKHEIVLENGDTRGQPHIFLLFSAALLGLYASCDFLPFFTALQPALNIGQIIYKLNLHLDILKKHCRSFHTGFLAQA
ncbi:hypothetical protein PHYPO_G00148770 [Pangasianodon hypophthalmus]|uniref:Ig-like domain-containing protein n=1 Tax=Pangasianodon hypophthalmus TaxID=310915 RepID=A0A5N5K4G5_PANHP|nr:myelin-oligodendrocyte glycoprotein [Pangasianodon hypophthalmus]XP_034155566.1 myelin-oligodendrocyte glycoprotein [Pangasianodon hypophthalmus]XP_053085567.1 myelin-oligodendrocyte glycoprotein [Pangasianodon hypophthalmus]KAB5526182.1 hypothetical protein PHYPO_G00148770 [Pangasianodon hypophthalmus]